MKRFVLTSSKDSQADEKIDVQPFKLSREMKDKDSIFEVIFIYKEVRYQYGFSLNRDQISEEWLIAYPDSKPQLWFERSSEKNWKFGSKFKGHKELLRDATRPNALFLSTAVQLNNEQLKPIYDWFKEELRIVVTELNPGFSIMQAEDEENRKAIVDFLRSADLNIQDLKIEKEIITEDKLPDDMPKHMKEDLLNNEAFNIRLLHDGNESELFNFEEDESEGTKKIFGLAGPWLDVLKKGRVLVVDELNNSLHSSIVRYLIKLVHQSKKNASNAQLIFSTHDTSILDTALFRRDQIWFVEKNKNGETGLYPLTDFSPRKKEALEKGYLSGRYGAVPFLGDINH
jgi:AAA15 family ATPase/GTPase